MKNKLIIVGLAALLVAGCGSEPKLVAKPVATPTVQKAVPVKKTGLLDATKLKMCLVKISAEPQVSTDNQLFAPLVQDPDFTESIDAWRNTYSPEGYASIYLWFFRTAEGAKRAKATLAEFTDMDLTGDDGITVGLPQADNVLWTTDLGLPSPEQTILLSGCFTKARS